MIAGIETTGDVCSVALSDAGSVLVSLHAPNPRRHDEALADLFSSALAQVNRNVSDLTALAVSVGPGSYTGIRIGIGFAIGISLASSLPLVAVPTLEAIAFSADGADIVAPMIDAGRGRCYTGVYRREPGFAELSAPCVIPQSEASALAKSFEARSLVSVSDAAMTVRYGAYLFNAGSRTDAAHIQALYIADSPYA